MLKARLVNYFDVWGNEEDGWEVNNLCNEGTIEFSIVEPTNVTDELMVLALIDFGFLIDTCTVKDLIIDDYWPFIEFSEARNGKPLCRLEFEID